MKSLDFLIGPSHLFLAFQKIVPYHLDLEKYLKIISKIMLTKRKY
jgi:hypothetical protein